MVEQLTLNQLVEGSNPPGVTKKLRSEKSELCDLKYVAWERALEIRQACLKRLPKAKHYYFPNHGRLQPPNS